MNSFAFEVKNEVSSTQPIDENAVYELMAIAKINGSINLSSKGKVLEIKTENVKVASRLHRLMKKVSQSNIEFLVSRKVRLKKNNTYIVRATTNIDELIKKLNFFDFNDENNNIYNIIKSDINKTKSYLRGCFLASGSVNSPRTSNYHLELTTNEKKHANYVAYLMTSFDIDGKIIVRRSNYVVYVKASDRIADFLKVIGATQGVLYYEGERAERDFLNNINRLDNCEIANDMKMIVAGQNQVEAIEKIIDVLGIEALDEKTKIVAEIRLENPDKSLNELCEIYFEKTRQTISKSGMHHRIKKITSLAKTLLKEE